MDFLIKIFKALANEHRVRLLNILIDSNEKEIAELADQLKLPYKTAARNLKILEQSNLVISRRRQGLVYYSAKNDNRLEYNKMIFKIIKKRHKTG
jgi:DNA-binding transcriptional ArsR family regulator